MGATAAMGLITIGAGFMKDGAEKKSAENEQVLAKFQADQLRVNAGQALASSQRDAISVDREAQLYASRALAVAASSGGGATDPTVVNIIAQGAADSAYRKAVALYEGEDRSRSMLLQADAVETGAEVAMGQSKARRMAMLVDSASSAYGGYARGTSMSSKYGGGAPTSIGEPYSVSKP